jgi:hypothetical protein
MAPSHLLPQDAELLLQWTILKLNSSAAKSVSWPKPAWQAQVKPAHPRR